MLPGTCDIKAPLPTTPSLNSLDGGSALSLRNPQSNQYVARKGSPHVEKKTNPLVSFDNTIPAQSVTHFCCSSDEICGAIGTAKSKGTDRDAPNHRSTYWV